MQDEVKEEPRDKWSNAAAAGEDRERYDTFPDDPTHGIFTEGVDSQGESSRVTWTGRQIGYKSHLAPERNSDELEVQMLKENKL